MTDTASTKKARNLKETKIFF